jgi:hypothetical protein
MPLSQKELPITFLLRVQFGGIPIPIPIPTPVIFGFPSGIVRPEQLAIHRPARGTVTHTAGAAFLDDYGPIITIRGHTGWANPEGLAGIASLKALEALFVAYLEIRRAIADAGNDPNIVELWFVDALNIEAFAVYPHEFILERQRSRPLLYFYRMRLSGLRDLLQEAAGGAVDLVANFSAASASAALGNLANVF